MLAKNAGLQKIGWCICILLVVGQGNIGLPTLFANGLDTTQTGRPSLPIETDTTQTGRPSLPIETDTTQKGRPTFPHETETTQTARPS
ncbi:MAG: hypothetical protein LAT57_10180 [Balneolales bacterium]|nr:hypothetical protein [Balneolales bacterium]